MSEFESASQAIGDALRGIPRHWDGRAAILEMKRSGSRQWRQMEWIGFYFQFLCESHLPAVVTMPGPKYGRAQFDGFRRIPWDFKAHAMNTSSHEIIVNDSLAVAAAIQQHGSVGVVLALGEVTYNDNDRSFQRWHDKLKGKQSTYVRKRIARGAWSRLRKVSLELQQISFIEITDETLIRCGSFQENFRNSNDRPRKAKVLIDLEQIDQESTYVVDFD